jgi:hypothetical protein
MGAQKIQRFRGDTVPDVFSPVDDEGLFLDPTGFTFRLSIDSREEPTDTSTQVLQMIGTLIGSPVTIQFSPTAAEADITPGDYFYDFQAIDGGGQIKTSIKDDYEILQDITKAEV